MKSEQHYFTILTKDGYHGAYATRKEAEHERRVLFGTRAIAHDIVRVAGKPRP